jgi:hypothetical protein
MVGRERPITDEDPTADLVATLSEVARTLSSGGTVEDTLALTLGLAESVIDGCDFAGLYLMDAGTTSVPTSTDPRVVELDTLQHGVGQGPSIDAITGKVSIYVTDLAEDPRWPQFGPPASIYGVHSLLALPLLAGAPAGALNLYGRQPRAFSGVDQARALLLAAFAGLALSSARTHEDDERRNVDLHSALITRELIGQAQGILIERERITADQAFDVLRRASQHLNVKLREVAQTLIDTGEDPDTGPSWRRK